MVLLGLLLAFYIIVRNMVKGIEDGLLLVSTVPVKIFC